MALGKTGYRQRGWIGDQQMYVIGLAVESTRHPIRCVLQALWPR